MNSVIAKQRMSEVMRVDTITTSYEDFMATHVPVKKLQLLHKFDLAPEEGNFFSEEDVYENIIKNPDDRHQFVVVYGASGTGKSHLIRWFATKLLHDKEENEVVLMIRRSDNTLKGAIRQLLDIPEVRNLPDHDLYKKLSEATSVVKEDVLKHTIYASLSVLIETDSGDQYANKLTNIERKRLSAFLKNDIVTEHMMQDEGPIERIYSKVAESVLSVRDTIAEFRLEDFAVDADFLEKMLTSGADHNAEKLAAALAADDDNSFKEKIVKYINQLVNPVIQQCANLKPGDFEQVFKDIRKELYRQGKKLTLFIEDVTAFTGVDVALLNVLTTSHTGDYAAEQMCRISSIIGTTTVYFQNNFNDNHKDRVTRFVYIPTDAFDEQALYDFVGKYLNTISLPSEEINAWVHAGAKDSEYPVHKLIEGEHWDTIKSSNGKELNLYPFTKRAIIYLATNMLSPDHRTPRYLLSNVMGPVLQDALYNRSLFPSENLKITFLEGDPLLRNFISQQCSGDMTLENRLINFTGIWGNNKAESYEKDGHLYISGLAQEIYQSLDMPVLKLTEVETPSEDSQETESGGDHKDSDDHPVKKGENPIDKLSADAKERIQKANELIEKWLHGAPISLTTSAGGAGLIRMALKDIGDFFYSTINWQIEGIANDHIAKIKDSYTRWIGLSNQAKGDAMYLLSCDRNTQALLECFIRYEEFGKKTWDYPDSQDDLFTAAEYVYAIKRRLATAVKESEKQNMTSYIEAAMACDFYRMVLNGTYSGKKTLKELDIRYFFDPETLGGTGSNNHTESWNSLLTKICMGKNMHDTVRVTVDQFYNIIQGGKSSASVLFIDSLGFDETLKKLKSDVLHPETFKLPLEEPNKDPIKKRRDLFEQLQKIVSRLPAVAEAEKANTLPYVEKIKTAFEINEFANLDTEDIIEFIQEVKRFHKAINEYGINVSVDNKLAEQVLKAPKKALDALKVVDSVSASTNPADVLLAYAADPLKDILPLFDLVVATNDEMSRADKDVKTKLSKISPGLDEAGSLYEDKGKSLLLSKHILESLDIDHDHQSD